MNENRLLKRYQVSIKEQNLNYANFIEQKAEIAEIEMFDENVNKENDQILMNNQSFNNPLGSLQPN